MQRVVELPHRGRLIVATDLQGNLADFRRVEELFEEAAGRPEGAVLVVTGDLVHGPEISEADWPSYLGSYFQGDSVAVLEGAQQLAKRHPKRVHFLLGNHEHAHLGGPVVAKFFPDEAKRLEALLGPTRSEEMRAWFASWPLVAVSSSARILMMHAAPAAAIRSRRHLESLSYDAPGGRPGEVDPLLGQLLWARTATAFRARAFLDAIDPTLQVAIYGHDVAREGYAIDREPLLCLSTSFGCFDGDKLYLDWDLGQPAESAADVAARGIKPLYPERAPVHRCDRTPTDPRLRHRPRPGDAASNDA